MTYIYKGPSSHSANAGCTLEAGQVIQAGELPPDVEKHFIDNGWLVAAPASKTKKGGDA